MHILSPASFKKLPASTPPKPVGAFSGVLPPSLTMVLYLGSWDMFTCFWLAWLHECCSSSTLGTKLRGHVSITEHNQRLMTSWCNVQAEGKPWCLALKLNTIFLICVLLGYLVPHKSNGYHESKLFIQSLCALWLCFSETLHKRGCLFLFFAQLDTSLFTKLYGPFGLAFDLPVWAVIYSLE